MSKATPLIQAKNISLTRGNNIVLDDVSLDISAGDFITLIGPNGAGKSMLLRCLLKLTQPDGGADGGTVHHASGLKIGYVPEAMQLDPTLPLTTRRFLMLNHKISPEQLGELAEETHITPLLDRPLVHLSGGERQRVLLARALVGQPNVLMLDEPAQNLDVKGQLHFYKLIEQIFQKHQPAILMVSHDLHLVMSSTHRVICLYHHICCSGAPENVMQDPEFISIFGNDMARLMAVYPHSHTHSHDMDAP